MQAPIVVIVMGVAGVGKTSLCEVMSRRLEDAGSSVIRLDADDFHSPHNIAKMRRGVPLDDADRGPWLLALSAGLERACHPVAAAAPDVVLLACSALKRIYRDALRGSRCPAPHFLHLYGTAACIGARLAARQAGGEHFMPVTLLASQLTHLEALAPDEQATMLALQTVQGQDKPLAALADEALSLPFFRRGGSTHVR